MILIDTSAIVPLFVQEEQSPSIRRYFELVRSAHVVSNLAAVEFSAVIARLWRTKEVSQAQGEKILSVFDQWRPLATVAATAEVTDVALADQYVRKFELKLHAPDAIHIALCHRLRASLLTLDQRMAAAAKVLGVPVAPLPAA